MVETLLGKEDRIWLFLIGGYYAGTTAPIPRYLKPTPKATLGMYAAINRRPKKVIFWWSKGQDEWLEIKPGLWDATLKRQHHKVEFGSCSIKNKAHKYSSHVSGERNKASQNSKPYSFSMGVPRLSLFSVLFLFRLAGSSLSPSLAESSTTRLCAIFDWVWAFNLVACVLMVSSCDATRLLASASLTNWCVNYVMLLRCLALRTFKCLDSVLKPGYLI